MERAIGEHETLISYDAQTGVFRWHHTDGRYGSDPAARGMSDETALARAEEIFARVGNSHFLNFCVDDVVEQ